MRQLINLRVWLGVFVCLMLCFSGVFAQKSQELGMPFIRNYSPREYQTDPQNWSITQDQRGVMHFGNTKGVLQYDGKNWNLIQVANFSFVHSLTADSAGTVFVGAVNELGYLASDSLGKAHYVSLKSHLISSFQKFGEVWEVVASKQGIYFFTNKYVFLWRRDTLHVITDLQARYAAKIGEEVFFVPAKGGIYRFRGTKAQKMPYSGFFKPSFGNYVLLPYQRGKMLVATEKRGFFIYEYAQKQGKFAAFIKRLDTQISSYIHTNGLADGAFVSAQAFAFATQTGGIVTMDAGGKLVQVINKNRGLPSDNCQAIFADRNQTLWAAFNNGLSKIETTSSVTVFNELNGLQGVVLATKKFKGKRYVGTVDGVFYLPDYELTSDDDQHQFKQLDPSAPCWDFFALDSTLYAAMSNGIIKIQGLSTEKVFETSKTYNFVSSKRFPNYVFLGMYDGLGLAKISNQGGKRKLAEFSRLKNFDFSVWSMVADKDGNLWIATLFNGVLHLRFGESPTEYKLYRFGKEHGLPRLNDMYADYHNGALLVATPKGLYKAVIPQDQAFAPEKIRFVPEMTFGEMFNRDSTGLSQIIIKGNKIWVNSELGTGAITQNFDGSYYWKPVPFKQKPTYTHRIFVEQSIAWLCTDEGLFRYDPNIPANESGLFQTLLSKVRLGADSVIFHGNFVAPESKTQNLFAQTSFQQPRLQVPEIDFRHNSLIFEFSATCYAKESDTEFSFRLKNFDPKWSEWQKSTQKEYTNLPPGDYSFWVKARNIYGQESPPVVFRFRISPPWYRTVLAYIAYGLVILGIFGLGIRIYTRRLEKANLELERIVAERTAELSHQKEEMKAQAEQLEVTNKELEKLSIVASETDNAVMIMDENGNFEWMNEGAIRMYGFSFQEFIEQRGKNIASASENPNVKEQIRHCIATKKSVSYESMNHCKNGEKIWAQTTLTPILTPEGEIKKLVAIDTDIGRLKEAEEAILQQKEEILMQTEKLAQANAELEQLSIVARETDNAVMIMDPDGNFEWINEGFTRIFGFNYEQLVGNVSKNIVGTNTSEHIRELVQRCIEKKETVSYEMAVTAKSGKKIWVQATLTPILDQRGDIKKLIAIDSDISRQKEAEQEIQKQRDTLKRRNEHIKSSIRYALTIQQAMLPLQEDIDRAFDSFIIYRPKDIVSGDFYWFSHGVPEEQNPEQIFLAVVDCTGHGVPGAFMSMIGNRLLSEIINEKHIFDPAQALEMLNQSIRKALKQNQTDNSDGMDVCLCRFEPQASGKYKITFCGAKRDLYFCKNQQELAIIKGSRKAIGGVRSRRSEEQFTNHQLELANGDMLYLTSDGLSDQNSEDRIRFGTRRMLELFNRHRLKPPQQQKQQIEKALETYQGNTSQRDDITVVGLKIKKHDTT